MEIAPGARDAGSWMTQNGAGKSVVSGPASGVIALLDEMLRLYERAVSMSAEAAGAGDGEGVLETLHRRQAVVDELRALDSAATSLRERLGGSAMGADDRAAVERKLAVVAGAARRLATADEELRAGLARRRDELADELASSGRGRAAHAAYASQRGDGAARMQDTEG